MVSSVLVGPDLAGRKVKDTGKRDEVDHDLEAQAVTLLDLERLLGDYVQTLG